MAVSSRAPRLSPVSGRAGKRLATTLHGRRLRAGGRSSNTSALRPPDTPATRQLQPREIDRFSTAFDEAAARRCAEGQDERCQDSRCPKTQAHTAQLTLKEKD